MSTPQATRTTIKTQNYKKVRLHWAQILETLTFLVTELVNMLLEISSRIVMILTGFPNAMSIYHVGVTKLGFAWYQSAVFAAVIELVIFVLVEISLKMLTRWVKGAKIFFWAFIVMCVVVAVATGVVMAFVNYLEPHKVMTLLPILSVCSFIGIGFYRWADKYDSYKSVKEDVKSSVKRNVKRDVKSPVGNMSNKRNSEEVEEVTEAEKQEDFTPRQLEILHYLKQFHGKPAGEFKKIDLAKHVKASRPTVDKDLKALQDAGKLSINGTVELL